MNVTIADEAFFPYLNEWNTDNIVTLITGWILFVHFDAFDQACGKRSDMELVFSSLSVGETEAQSPGFGSQMPVEVKSLEM